MLNRPPDGLEGRFFRIEQFSGWHRFFSLLPLSLRATAAAVLLAYELSVPHGPVDDLAFALPSGEIFRLTGVSRLFLRDRSQTDWVLAVSTVRWKRSTQSAPAAEPQRSASAA